MKLLIVCCLYDCPKYAFYFNCISMPMASDVAIQTIFFDYIKKNHWKLPPNWEKDFSIYCFDADQLQTFPI